MPSEHLGARKRWGPPWGFSRSREATLSGDGWAGVNLWVAPTQDGLAKPGCVQSLYMALTGSEVTDTCAQGGLPSFSCSASVFPSAASCMRI